MIIERGSGALLSYILVIIFITNSMRGQDTPVEDSSKVFHVFGITTGLNQLKDENLIPLVHTGYIVTLSYNHRTEKRNYQDFNFSLGISRVIARYEDVTKSLNALLNSSYSYYYKLRDKDHLSLFLAPKVHLFYSFGFFPNWDDSHAYWADYFSLGPELLSIYKVTNNQNLYLTISLPLFYLYSRPEYLRLYKIDDVTAGGFIKSMNSNIHAGTWNSVFTFNFNMEYHFPILKDKSEAVSYSLGYLWMKAETGEPFTQLIHQLGLKVLL